jgi:hypothetical protein
MWGHYAMPRSSSRPAVIGHCYGTTPLDRFRGDIVYGDKPAPMTTRLPEEKETFEWGFDYPNPAIIRTLTLMQFPRESDPVRDVGGSRSGERCCFAAAH